MAHPYHKEAKEGHAKKLSGYGGKGKTYDGKGTWDGLKGLGNEDQAGLKIIDKEPSLSEETAPRIMRKKGGKVMGKKAVARLDKPKRKGRDSGGQLPSPYEAAESEKRMKNIDYSDDKEGGTTSASEAASSAGRQEDKRGGRVKKAAGGKMSKIEWEHSKKDLAQDKKLAKKHGMKLEKWEHSKLDEKHDRQQSTEGLKRGGAPKTKSYIPENPITKSARVGRDKGGSVNGKGSKTVMIFNLGKDQDQGMGMPIPAPGAPAGRPPFMGQMPPQMPVGMPMAPAMAGVPAGAPPMAPPPSLPPGGMGGAPMGGAGMPPPGGPRPFKRGGRIRNASDLDAGAGSGEGRLEKIELQNAKGWPPKGARKGFK